MSTASVEVSGVHASNVFGASTLENSMPECFHQVCQMGSLPVVGKQYIVPQIVFAVFVLMVLRMFVDGQWLQLAGVEHNLVLMGPCMLEPAVWVR